MRGDHCHKNIDELNESSQEVDVVLPLAVSGVLSDENAHSTADSAVLDHLGILVLLYRGDILTTAAQAED